MERAERFSIVMVLVVAFIVISAGNATVWGAGNGLSTNGLLRFSANKVEMIHDFLGDSSHFYEVEKASMPPDEEWSSAGAPTILYDGGMYYLSLRRWNPSGADPDRGYRFEMWKHEAGNLLTPWTFVWGIDKAEIDEMLLVIDRPCLRKFDGVYYYYFGFTFGECGEWSVAYVSDGAISGIRDKLSDQTTWGVIYTGGMKDPWVTKFGDKYYLCLFSSLYPKGYFIMESATPSFETLLSLPTDLHKPYSDMWGEPEDSNIGPILYDPSSGKYLYWGTARHGSDIYWFWVSSDDLKNWVYAGREMAFNWGHSVYTTARYQDYSLDNGKAVLVMEWDSDKDRASSTFIWEYPIIPPQAEFVVENLSVMPAEVSLGDELTVSADVANVGGAAGSYTVVLEVDGSVTDNQTVTLNPGQSTTVTFTLSVDELGAHTVSVDGLSGSFEVIEAEPADFKVENLSISPETVVAGEPVTISVDVANIGATAGSKLVKLKIDGALTDSKSVALDPGESKPVSFTVSKSVVGMYSVSVDNLAGSFEVIEAGPAEFAVENLSISPGTVSPGGQVTVSVGATNTGDAAGSYTVVLKVDGSVTDNRTVTLNPGQSTMVAFTLSVDEPGTHTVSVDGLSGSFEVLVPEQPGEDIPLVLLVIGAVIAVVAAVVGLLYWRRSVK